MNKAFASLALILAVLMIYVRPASAQQPKAQPLVNTIRIEGPIDPAMALYVHRSIRLAEQNRAQALVVLLETPGGLDDSMRSIIKDFFASKVPIVVYVWPNGARAASAGAIITLASNIAAMSPSSAIGAAHPVGFGGGQLDDTMAKKVENDAAAYSRSIAQRRRRNVEWAELVVRESVSASAQEAKEKNVIDIIAKNLDDLLQQIDGRRVNTSAGAVTIRTKNARTEKIDMNVRESFLHVIDNPNIVYLLMLIGLYGIIFELSNPGLVFPGVIGGISLILAMVSLAVLPVNLTGIILLIFGIALMIADVFVPDVGILTVGGVISFVVGSIMLFETNSPAFSLSLVLVITMAILTGGFFLFAVGAGFRAQKGRIVTGKEGMIGKVVEARTDIDPKGKVFAEGTLWNAETVGEPIRKGESVRIVGMENLTIKVVKE